jgi:predicted transcriptional regulator
MTLVGLMLNEHEQSVIDEQISVMLKAKQEIKKAQSEVDADTAVAKLTIQDHLREKVSECCGEMEAMFDDFVVAGAKMSADFSPIKLMRGMNISPNMIGTVSRVWELRLAEFNEVLEGKDDQLVEGYSHLTKLQLRNCVKFCETVINDCNSYVQLKKVERKPRAKKAVSPEKLTRKFKFLREFEELKLKSEPVTKLVNASEAWLYDTAKRKLIHVVADAHIGTFTVKGSAVVAFDVQQTMQKTLRKPAEQIKSITSVGKPAARKAFTAIKATETKWNGRGNDNLIILWAW